MLEFVDALEYNGQQYQAFFPAETEGEDEDDPDNGLVILKVIHEDGEDLLSTLDSDEELDAVYELFMESLFDEDESPDIRRKISPGPLVSLHPGPGCDTVNMMPCGVRDRSFFNPHFVIRDARSVRGSQASRLLSAAGSWK